MTTSSRSRWTPAEAGALAKLYPTNISCKELHALFPRHTPGSISAYARRILKVSRPADAPVQRATPGWDRLRELLAIGPLTAGEMADRCGISTQAVHEVLGKNRAEVHVTGWRPPTRTGPWLSVWALGAGIDVDRPLRRPKTLARPKGAARRRNPFLIAAGLVRAPAGAPGRIYRQPMNELDDEVAA